jgi:hypothetical protein
MTSFVDEQYLVLYIIKFIPPTTATLFNLCAVSQSFHTVLTNSQLVGDLWNQCTFNINIRSISHGSSRYIQSHVNMYLLKQKQLGPNNINPLIITNYSEFDILLNTFEYLDILEVKQLKLSKNVYLLRILNENYAHFIERNASLYVVQIESNLNLKQTTITTNMLIGRALPETSEKSDGIQTTNYTLSPTWSKTECCFTGLNLLNIEIFDTIVIQHSIPILLTDRIFPRNSIATVIDNTNSPLTFKHITNVKIANLPLLSTTTVISLYEMYDLYGYIKSKFPAVKKLELFGNIWDLTYGNRFSKFRSVSEDWNLRIPSQIQLHELHILGSDVPDVFKEQMKCELSLYFSFDTCIFESNISSWKEIEFDPDRSTDMKCIQNTNWYITRIQNILGEDNMFSKKFMRRISFYPRSWSQSRMRDLLCEVSTVYNSLIFKEFNGEVISHADHIASMYIDCTDDTDSIVNIEALKTKLLELICDKSSSNKDQIDKVTIVIENEVKILKDKIHTVLKLNSQVLYDKNQWKIEDNSFLNVLYDKNQWIIDNIADEKVPVDDYYYTLDQDDDESAEYEVVDENSYEDDDISTTNSNTEDTYSDNEV